MNQAFRERLFTQFPPEVKDAYLNFWIHYRVYCDLEDSTGFSPRAALAVIESRKHLTAVLTAALNQVAARRGVPA